MADEEPMTRKIIGEEFVKHTYTNYDVDEVKKDYKELSEERDRVYAVLSDIYENVEFETDNFEITYDEVECYSFYGKIGSEYDDQDDDDDEIWPITLEKPDDFFGM